MTVFVITFDSSNQACSGLLSSVAGAVCRNVLFLHSTRQLLGIILCHAPCDTAIVRSNDRFTVNDLQWMPSHSATSSPTRGGGQEAAALPQSTVPVDVGNAHRATIRSARDSAVAD
ncbi:hypothetical protein FJT64_015597 [Amphibalanus amphitrite]|uniref:Uncharacterized protein n=1 Tax=Amphibalanus amphitrite TaxID=1232801 RepID=A0A6A4XF92_AMPAM|nr:hypothetical protein FJT64_015597 [Amphibalanus amphitrite]